MAILRAAEDDALRAEALTVLAVFYTRAGRSFEAISVARRIRRLAIGNVRLAAFATSNIALGWSAVGHHEGAEAANAQLRALTASSSEAHLEPYVRHLRAVTEATLACRSSDPARLRAAITAFEASRRISGWQHDEHFAAECRATLAWRTGEPGRAASILRASLSSAELPPRCRLSMLLLRTRILRETDLAAMSDSIREAVAVGAACLDEARSQIVLSACIELARTLEDLPPTPLTGQAYDLAASAVLRRLSALARFVDSAPPEIAPLTEDLHILRAVRKQSMAQLGEIRRRVTALLPTIRQLPFALDDHVLRLCAWCDSAATSDDAWLPIGQFLGASEAVMATHTICPRCEHHLFPDA